jgi:hypothetical protein
MSVISLPETDEKVDFTVDLTRVFTMKYFLKYKIRKIKKGEMN